MACRQRDMSYPFAYRPPSSSATTSSSDDREEIPMVRHPYRRPESRSRNRTHHQGSHCHGLNTVPFVDHYQLGMHPAHVNSSTMHGGSFGRSGTLRSTRSVPTLALTTWDGEPCPVHGHNHHRHHQGHHPVGNGGPPMFTPSGPQTIRRYGSLYDVRGGGMLYQPPPPSIIEKKSMHGSMQMLPIPFSSGYPQIGPTLPSSLLGGHFPPHFVAPALMRSRPMVIPAGAEPLPVRDPFKLRTSPPGFVPKMEEEEYSMDQVCCKGHLIVLWIILGVVTVGVILGIILGVTIA